jgi:hypothetical protein
MALPLRPFPAVNKAGKSANARKEPRFGFIKQAASFKTIQLIE